MVLLFKCFGYVHLCIHAGSLCSLLSLMYVKNIWRPLVCQANTNPNPIPNPNTNPIRCLVKFYQIIKTQSQFVAFLV